MMARSGNMQIAPMAPVKVSVPRDRPTPSEAVPPSGADRSAFDPAVCRKMEGLATGQNRAIVTYAHPRTQGADCQAAGAARSLSVLQRRGRDDLRGQGAGAAGPRPQLPRRVRRRSED